MTEAPLTPEEIRAMRGDLSRAAFGRMVGVTGLTVYRWELPRDAPESRTPRSRTRARIRDAATRLRRGERPAGPELTTRPSAPLSQTEQEALLPALDSVLRGRFRRAESAVLEAIGAGGQLESDGSRALASVVAAGVQLFARGDAGAAAAILSPLLPRADAFPERVSVWLHTFAALTWSAPDGRVFDVGRANNHSAWARRKTPVTGAAEARCLQHIAELRAAFYYGDYSQFERLLDQQRDVLAGARTPLVVCLREEARSLESHLAARVDEASRRLTEAATTASAAGVIPAQLRAQARLAINRLEEGEPAELVLALVRGAASRASAERLAPGLHDVMLAAAEAEALLRLARFDDAEAALAQGRAAAATTAIPAIDLAYPELRLRLYTGRGRSLEDVAEALSTQERSPLGRDVRAAAAFLTAPALTVQGELGHAADTWERAADMAREARARPWLERVARAAALGYRVYAGDVTGAHTTMRRAERMLDRLPSVWTNGLVHQFRGLLHGLEGRQGEADQALRTALATFEQAGDRPQAAVVRRALAIVAGLRSRSEGVRLRQESEEELRHLGFMAPPGLREDTVDELLARQAEREPTSGPPINDGDVPSTAELVVPVTRLAIRGAAPDRLADDLVEIARQVTGPCAMRLEEVKRDDAVRVLVQRGPLSGDDTERFEFGDGVGHRLRLVVAGPLSEERRAALRVLATTAGLALEVATLRGHGELGEDEGSVPEIPGFVAAAPASQRLKRELARLRFSESTVLVSGESGTGKEVVAAALHHLSRRGSRPYVTFNCSAVPRELFEGQLFGYRRGAFTGATKDYPGVIRAAHRGTLFLDEIGDLPLDLQPKLLRFLENGEVFPLGQTRPVEVDVRVIAATHRDLRTMARQGVFREDLLYRLQVVPLEVAPLRDRREDVLALARHFLAELTDEGHEPPLLAPDAETALLGHDWPGNVRELRNVAERLLAFSPPPRIVTAAHLNLNTGGP